MRYHTLTLLSSVSLLLAGLVLVHGSQPASADHVIPVKAEHVFGGDGDNWLFATAAGDYDGDGCVEFFTGGWEGFVAELRAWNYCSGTILPEGQDTWGRQFVDYGVLNDNLPWFRDLTVGDVDSDGMVEVVGVISWATGPACQFCPTVYKSELRIWEAGPSGPTLVATTIWGSPEDFEEVRAVVTCDPDHDGRDEIATVNDDPDTDTFDLNLWELSGGSVVLLVSTSDALRMRTFGVACGDVDDDNVLEFATIASHMDLGHAELKVWSLLGPAFVPEASTTWKTFTRSGPLRVGAAELDSDAGLEMVVVGMAEKDSTNEKYGELLIASKAGGTIMHDHLSQWLPSGVRWVVTVGLTLADRDLDSRIEIVTASQLYESTWPERGQLVVREFTDGSLLVEADEQWYVPSSPAQADAFDVTVAQLDSDGCPDILTVGRRIELPPAPQAQIRIWNSCTPCVRGVVWNDVNRNAIRDLDHTGNLEPGLWGIRVNLYLGADHSNLVGTTTTTYAGSYVFANLVPGFYHVVELDLPGWLSSTPNDVHDNLVSCTPGAIVNFGDYFAQGPSAASYAVSTGVGGGQTIQLPVEQSATLCFDITNSGLGSQLFFMRFTAAIRVGSVLDFAVPPVATWEVHPPGGGPVVFGSSVGVLTTERHAGFDPTGATMFETATWSLSEPVFLQGGGLVRFCFSVKAMSTGETDVELFPRSSEDNPNVADGRRLPDIGDRANLWMAADTGLWYPAHNSLDPWDDTPTPDGHVWYQWSWLMRPLTSGGNYAKDHFTVQVT